MDHFKYITLLTFCSVVMSCINLCSAWIRVLFRLYTHRETESHTNTLTRRQADWERDTYTHTRAHTQRYNSNDVFFCLLQPVYRTVDLHCQANNSAHHTSDISTEELIIRRGQSFLLNLELPRPFNPNTDQLHFTVKTGEGFTKVFTVTNTLSHWLKYSYKRIGKMYDRWIDGGMDYRDGWI